MGEGSASPLCFQTTAAQAWLGLKLPNVCRGKLAFFPFLSVCLSVCQSLSLPHTHTHTHTHTNTKPRDPGGKLRPHLVQGNPVWLLVKAKNDLALPVLFPRQRVLCNHGQGNVHFCSESRSQYNTNSPRPQQSTPVTWVMGFAREKPHAESCFPAK